jgi:hypothetical protein
MKYRYAKCLKKRILYIVAQPRYFYAAPAPGTILMRLRLLPCCISSQQKLAYGLGQFFSFFSDFTAVLFCSRYFFSPILFPLFDTVSEYRKSKFVIRYTILRYLFSPIFRYFFLYPISIEYRNIDTCIGSAQLCPLYLFIKNFFHSYFVLCQSPNM